MSDEPYRITVVCWGNICRSPMGEFMLRDAIEDAGLGDRVVVDSMGTSAEELGHGMDRRSVAVLGRKGVRDTGFAQHRARRFRREDFEDIDLVLAADHVHDRILRGLARDEDDTSKIHLFRSFDPDAVAADHLAMDDPWYGNDASFDQTYDEIEAALPGIVEHVRSELG